MNLYRSPACQIGRQRGMVLIMSLIFLLLLALASAALFETTTSQARLSVAQQLSREQFLNIQCALSMISSQSGEIQKQVSTMQPGAPRSLNVTNCGLPDDASIQLVLLKPGYACVVPGFSDGSCLALEIQGEAENGAAHAESSQVQGLLFETVSVAGGGDSRAGIFN